MVPLLMLISLLAAAVYTLPTAAFDRLFVVVLENTDYRDAIKDNYLGTTLAAKGRLLTNYYATTHPSQPNYLSMISGIQYDVANDDVEFKDRTIVDLLEEKGLDWKSYQEDLPSACFTGSNANKKLYRRKHNPFVSFSRIVNSPARCNNIVPATTLASDISSKKLANFMFYTPNMNNDGHDTSVTYASKWLNGFLEPLLVDPAFKSTLFVVTFDESGSNSPNQVYTLLLGAGVQAGTRDATSYSHFSLISTMENAWGLGNLGQKDVGALPFKLQ